MDQGKTQSEIIRHAKKPRNMAYNEENTNQNKPRVDKDFKISRGH